MARDRPRMSPEVGTKTHPISSPRVSRKTLWSRPAPPRTPPSHADHPPVHPPLPLPVNTSPKTDEIDLPSPCASAAKRPVSESPPRLAKEDVSTAPASLSTRSTSTTPFLRPTSTVAIPTTPDTLSGTTSTHVTPARRSASPQVCTTRHACCAGVGQSFWSSFGVTALSPFASCTPPRRITVG